jgi:hypothetical protein
LNEEAIAAFLAGCSASETTPVVPNETFFCPFICRVRPFKILTFVTKVKYPSFCRYDQIPDGGVNEVASLVFAILFWF